MAHYDRRGLLPLIEAKGEPLVKNIDIVKFEMGLHFPSSLGGGLLPLVEAKGALW